MDTYSHPLSLGWLECQADGVENVGAVLLPHRPLGKWRNTAEKTKTPQSLDSAGFSLPSLAETEGFEPSIQVLAQMLP